MQIFEIKKEFSQAIRSILPSYIYCETFFYSSNSHKKVGARTKKVIPVFINTNKNLENLIFSLETNFSNTIKSIEDQSGKIFTAIKTTKTVENIKKQSIDDIKLITVFLRVSSASIENNQTIYVAMNFHGFTKNLFLEEVSNKIYLRTKPEYSTLFKVDNKVKLSEYRSDINLVHFSYLLSDAVSVF